MKIFLTDIREKEYIDLERQWNIEHSKEKKNGCEVLSKYLWQKFGRHLPDGDGWNFRNRRVCYGHLAEGWEGAK